MTPRTQSIAVGAVAGAVTWVAFFLLYAQRKQPALEALGAEIAPQIAEDAAKQYIATRYGLTPAVIRGISSRVGLVTNLVDAFRR